MKGYYWKHPKTGAWYWRENLYAENWQGPFSSKKNCRNARAEFYDRLAKNRASLCITIGGI